MPIEKDLKRIADALEIIAAQMDGATAAPKTAKPKPVAQPALASVPPAPVAAPIPAAPVAAVLLSPEELNATLVAEFKRIGDRKPIDDAMAALGVVSVGDLPNEKQAELIAAVKAIPA